MHSTLATLIDRLDSPLISRSDVIQWGCPVPSFGDLLSSRVATLGLNPSNREFMDENGHELDGSRRRFHTLNSLGLSSWSEVDSRQISLIIDSCRKYFLGNPYDNWFKRLDQIVSAAKASFYNEKCNACHLDLIPYATAKKWTELTFSERASLLSVAADTLGLLLRDSPVKILILNGRSVVDHFQLIAGISLGRQEMPSWALSRRPKPNVTGWAYKGWVSSISGITLTNQILVLGYNHNLQSSFGVTREVIHEIRRWVDLAASEVSI
jgi:hypothetical protein